VIKFIGIKMKVKIYGMAWGLRKNDDGLMSLMGYGHELWMSFGF
jgi:hypothetical protein